MSAADELTLLVRLREATRLFERLHEARQSGASELAIQEQLRRDYPAALVRAAVALEELRRRGEAKFSQAGRMWFDAVGLEQATSEAVARHKARRFTGRAWDLCCGIGGDALALAGRGGIVAVDVDPAACLRAQWNVEAYGHGNEFAAVCADVESLDLPGELVHIDPDRRPGGRPRSRRIEQLAPPMEFLGRLMTSARGGAIKLSPAANFGGKFREAEIELVSLAGECKEATVWFGELRGREPWRATVLPAGETIEGHPLESFADVAPLGRYLFDPDPAVVRAGLVDVAAERLALARLDDAEEYLTGDAIPASSFVRPFEVLAELPNNRRDIRRYFRTAGFGDVEIKCRHVPVDAEAMRRKLPLAGEGRATLFVCRLAGRTRAVVGRRV
ncbi:MAG: hypothetical protein KY476_24660 [Planctomycetes bacterium]|nr:hypothetical protein [Planctomycetota bacterium]